MTELLCIQYGTRYESGMNEENKKTERGYTANLYL